MKKAKQFIWHGIDMRGFKVSGEITAPDAFSAKNQIANQKITPLKLTRKFDLPFFSGSKIKEADITAMVVEFYTLMSAGIPLIQALRILISNTRKPAMKSMLCDITKQVENGSLLSTAIQSQERYLGSLFCQLIYVGEQSGMLDLILKQLVSYREKAASLKRKIKKACLYPALVLIVAFSVTCAMLLFVLPQFEQLFQSVGAELPWLTRVIIYVADLLRQYGGILFFMLLLLVWAMRFSVRRFIAFEMWMDRVCIRIPVMGRILQEAIFARCFRALSTTLSAGLPLIEALTLTANVAGNSVYKKAFLDICGQVKNGQVLNVCFQKEELFPNRVMQMITIGEESGRLDEMTQKLGDYFEEQVDYKVENLSQLLEPLLMLVLCFVVGVIVVAMYLPVFRLGSVV